MIYIPKKDERFIYSSFKERVYSHTNTLPDVDRHRYEPVISFSKFDLTFYSANTECVVEIKVRDFDSGRYDSTMIEVDKYNYLINQYEETGKLPFYQCYFTDGQVLIFNLLHCDDIQTEFINCPKYSSTETREYIQKPVKNLPVDRAMRFSYQIPPESEIKRLFNQRYKAQ